MKYELTEGRQDYRTGYRIIYEERELPMDIGKVNYDKDRRSKCFNCNIWKKNTRNQERKEKQGNTINMIRQDTLLETTEQDRR